MHARHCARTLPSATAAARPPPPTTAPPSSLSIPLPPLSPSRAPPPRVSPHLGRRTRTSSTHAVTHTRTHKHTYTHTQTSDDVLRRAGPRQRAPRTTGLHGPGISVPGSASTDVRVRPRPRCLGHSPLRPPVATPPTPHSTPVHTLQSRLGLTVHRVGVVRQHPQLPTPCSTPARSGAACMRRHAHDARSSPGDRHPRPPRTVRPSGDDPPVLYRWLVAAVMCSRARRARLPERTSRGRSRSVDRFHGSSPP